MGRWDFKGIPIDFSFSVLKLISLLGLILENQQIFSTFFDTDVLREQIDCNLQLTLIGKRLLLEAWHVDRAFGVSGWVSKLFQE